MRRKWSLHGVGGLALTGVLFVGATGCSSDGEPEADQDQAASSDAGDGANLDIGDDGVSVQDDEGQGFSTRATTEVPDAIADLVPLPDGFAAEGTTETSLEDAESTVLVGTLDTEDPSAVMADIEEALTAEGLETLSNSDIGGEMYTLSMFAEDEVQVTVAIVDDGDEGEPAQMNVTVTRPTA